MADMDGRMGGEKRTARRVVKIAPRRVGTGLRAIPHLGLTRRATFAAWNRRINEAALLGRALATLGIAPTHRRPLRTVPMRSALNCTIPMHRPYVSPYWDCDVKSR